METETIKVDLTELSPVKRKMQIEVSPDEVERETVGVVKRYQKSAKVPGFRQGKTPLQVIRARFAEQIAEDVRERLVSRSFVQATRERGLQPVGDPSLEDLAHESGKPLSFKTTFEVLPELKVDGYKELDVRRPSTRVTDAEVDEALEGIRQSRATHVYEKDRAAQQGDIVVADVHGTPKEGEPFSRERTPVEIGAQGNLPAFDEHLTGAREGAELTFDVEYPEEYPAQELAGTQVAFRLVVHEVKKRSVPELDDELAKDLGDFDGLGALRAKVREDLEARKSHQADHATRQAILDKVLLGHTVALPETLVEREVRNRLEDVVRRMMMQGIDPEASDIDWSQMRQQQDAPARKAVHARLVLDAIAAAEGIEVADREVDERIRVEAQRVGESPQAIRKRLQKGNGIQALKTQLVREKTLDYLTSVANIQNED